MYRYFSVLFFVRKGTEISIKHDKYRKIETTKNVVRITNDVLLLWVVTRRVVAAASEKCLLP